MSGCFFLKPCVRQLSAAASAAAGAAIVSQKWLELTVQSVELVLQIVQLCFIFGLSARSGIELHLEIGKLDLRFDERRLLIAIAGNRSTDRGRQCDFRGGATYLWGVSLFGGSLGFRRGRDGLSGCSLWLGIGRGFLPASFC